MTYINKVGRGLLDQIQDNVTEYDMEFWSCVLASQSDNSTKLPLVDTVLIQT